jgi:hypothetical protein
MVIAQVSFRRTIDELIDKYLGQGCSEEEARASCVVEIRRRKSELLESFWEQNIDNVVAVGSLDPIELLTKDLKEASSTLSDREARYLVDSYYLMQDARKRANNQIRALGEAAEPHSVIRWFATNTQKLETNIKAVLGVYASSREIGRWSQSITGIGPVISAGLMAYIDLEKTSGHSELWSFAGYSPEAKWEKGQKRPWSAGLKVLGYKAGESFVKTCHHKSSFYGPYYIRWKAEEERLNEAGEFAEQAAAELVKKNYGKETIARKYYEQGKLPPAHVHARARRKVAKLFLSHWWEVAHECYYGTKPEVKPYVVDRLGHKDYVKPPGWS